MANLLNYCNRRKQRSKKHSSEDRFPLWLKIFSDAYIDELDRLSREESFSRQGYPKNNDRDEGGENN